MLHYSIEDEADYFSLALALARDHVPGFSVKLRELKLSQETWGAVEPKISTGRQRYWTSERLSQLLDDVENAEARTKPRRGSRNTGNSGQKKVEAASESPWQQQAMALARFFQGRSDEEIERIKDTLKIVFPPPAPAAPDAARPKSSGK